MAPELSPEVLNGIVSRTLEEAAFLFTEPVEAPTWTGEELLEVRIELTGSRRAEVRVCGEPALGIALAANFLGVEPNQESALAHAQDALKELANLLGAGLIGPLLGGGVDDHIGVPEVRRGTAAEVSGRFEGAACACSLATEDGEGLRVAIFLSPPAAEAGAGGSRQGDEVAF